MTNKLKYKNITYFMKKHYLFLMKILFIFFSMNCFPGPQEADVKTFFFFVTPATPNIFPVTLDSKLWRSQRTKKKKNTLSFSKNNHVNINTKF